MKNIGLTGLTFDCDNKGCMALAYSFVEIIKKHIDIDDIDKIYLFSFDNYTIPKAIDISSKMELIHVSLKQPLSIKKLKHKLKQCDVVFDFTEGDSFSDIYGIKRFIKMTYVKSMAIKYATKYVLCPQTFGPFKSKLSQKIAKYIFNHSTYICSRDVLSAEVVNHMINRKVDVFTDVAFGLNLNEIDELEKTNKKRVGINVSALLWNGGYTGNNQFNLTVDYQRYISALIDCLSNMFEIHLIPHVYNDMDNNIENDYTVIKDLMIKYPFCKVPPYYQFPGQIKKYISCMDFFIGARMHSTIAAFSSGVVTIPFSYSRKFEGLYNGLNYNYVIDAKKVSTEEAINLTYEYIQKPDELISHQKEAMVTIQQKLEDFNAVVQKILCEE